MVLFVYTTLDDGQPGLVDDRLFPGNLTAGSRGSRSRRIKENVSGLIEPDRTGKRDHNRNPSATDWTVAEEDRK